MSTYDAYIPLDINLGVSNDLMSGLNQAPTMNVGELAQFIDEET